MGVVRLFERDPLHLHTARWLRRLGRLVTKVNPWRLHITGSENIERGKTYVIVANHQSLADIPLVTHVRIDSKWMGKRELFSVPLFGWMLTMAGDVPVERGDRRKAAHSLLQCVRYLRAGLSIVFFPEGTRSQTGEVLPFNDGPFQLAIREKIPILPLAIEGSGSALPRATWIFSGTQDIHLTIMPAVSVEDYDVKRCRELREAVRERIAAQVERLRMDHTKRS